MALNLASYVGQWILVGSTAINHEVEFVGEEPDPNGVRDWLNGDGIGLVTEADATSGLTLTIDPDGSFSEQKTGSPVVDWYDFQGVMTDGVQPFSGLVLSNGSHFYLRPADIPQWGTPVDGKYGPAILRLDGGDTIVCDRIDILGDQLIRTINVVTDELYLDRVVVVYQRRPA